MKNGLQKNIAVAGMGLVLCAEATLEIEEEENIRNKKIASKKKVKEWLKRREQQAHNSSLL